jgi:hypothetical protein
LPVIARGRHRLDGFHDRAVDSLLADRSLHRPLFR